MCVTDKTKNIVGVDLVVRETPELLRAVAEDRRARKPHEPDISKWAKEYEPGVTPIKDEPADSDTDIDD